MATTRARLAGLLTLAALSLVINNVAFGATRAPDFASLDPVTQGVISGAIGAKDPAFRMGMEGRSVRARNGQSLSAKLGAEGMAISVADSQWRLSLSGWGREDALRVAPAVETRVKDNRIEVDRGGLTEWWVNGPVGIQQGWTVAQRPAGHGELVLALAQSGPLRASAASATALEVRDAKGATALRYGGLTALDARGRKLPVRFDVRSDEVRIHVDDANAAYPLLIDPIAQQAYVKASNTRLGAQFGISLAMDGNTLVVGSRGENSNATGVNGNQANTSAPNAGAVYVFTRSGATWTQEAYLKASNTRINAYFGAGVAISGDTIVVGSYGENSNATGVNGNQADTSASQAGAAYVFTRTAGTWSQQAYLKASNAQTGDLFGVSVGIAGDSIVVGAEAEASSATGVNGNQADNGAVYAGAAYVFTRSGATWTQQAYLKASNTGAQDQFGDQVAISGDTIVVGAGLEGSNATGVNGNQADNSATFAGAVYVFTRSGVTWSQQAYIKASNTGAGDNFGAAIAIEGDTLVVGATGEDSNATGVNGNQANNATNFAGAAYVFTRSGATWTQEAYLKASNPAATQVFGDAVALSGDTIVVGAYGEGSNATGVNGDQSNNSLGNAGAAYVFKKSGGTWSQVAYLKASNTDALDNFGYAVLASGNTIFSSAVSERSSATGINGNQADNSMNSSGAVYVFQMAPPVVTSIVPAGTTPTAAASVDFTVTFDSPVTGVDASDFGLTTTGAIAGASVTGVTGSGATYTVSVSTGTGSGTLRLDVVDDDTIVNILPLGGVGAGNGGFTTGTAYTLDRTAPVVTSVTMPASGNYITGATLGSFTVNWDEAVVVTGTPQIALTIGATTRQATFASGSGTSALTFSYLVVAGDNDNDGIAVGALTLNGGTLQDAQGNTATLTLNSVGSSVGVLVNRTFAVTPSAGANGTISPNTVQAIADGASTTFIVTPSVGFTAIVGGTCGGNLVGSTYTTNTVTAACTVAATFTLNTYAVTPSAGANGTITPSTPQSVAHGGTIAFTVMPSTGYTAAVAGTCGGNLVGNTYTTNVITGPCTVAASFTQNTYAVTPSAGANGTITPSTPQTIAHGATTSFTVTPSAGYAAVVGGTCGGNLVGTTYTTNAITAACTVTASFTQNTYTVTPSAGANGSITPATPQTIAHGATASFTVTPSAGYATVVGGTCGGNLVGNTYTTNVVTGPCTVAASFTQITYAVTPSAGANGTITPATPQTVAHGATRTFTVTPSAGYAAVVGGTCGGNLVGTTYTTNAITAACTVTASFTQNTYTVTPSAGANGTITPSTPQTIAHGATTSFTVTPSSGYYAVVGGTCGGNLVGTTYTTNPVTAACTVAASFASGAVTTHTSTSPTGSGTITATLSGGGATCTLTSPQFIPLVGHARSPPAGVAPSGVTFPHGLFDFTTTLCTPGSTITIAVTYPAALPAGTLYWKYGPTPGNVVPHWYTLPATIAGNTATFSITDGQLGDDDVTANGTIVDQGGPGVPGSPGTVNAIPTLSQWMLMLLATLMAALTTLRLRRD